MRGAFIEQTSQLVREFSSCSKITLELAYLILRSGDLFRCFLIEHCRDDIELRPDCVVSRGGGGSKSVVTDASLFCNTSVNDIREFFRRPDDPHNCELFILELIRCDRCKAGKQIGVKPLRLFLSVIPTVRRNDRVRRAFR